MPVEPVADGLGPDRPEDDAWLQGGCGCGAAEASSNRYFASPEYRRVYDDSLAFYRGLGPVVGASLADDALDYKNAYSGAWPLDSPSSSPLSPPLHLLLPSPLPPISPPPPPPRRAADAAPRLRAPVFDVVHVATIHNASIPAASLLMPSVRARLYALASEHE